MKVLMCLFFFYCLKINAVEITLVTENFPDFQYVDNNSQLVGRSLDKVKTALDNINIKYTILVDNWTVSYNAALRDENTCIFSIARMHNREHKFQWIAELENFESAIYALKSRNIKINTLNDAKRYKIAVLRENYGHHYLLDNNFSESKNLLLIESLDNIDELISTRYDVLDLVVLGRKQFYHRVKNQPKLKLLEPVFNLNDLTSPLYFACNINMAPALVLQLKRAFKKIYTPS
jgi:polar amino acid transport system substrate-binding protein